MRITFMTTKKANHGLSTEQAKKIRARWDKEVAEALKSGKTYTSTREMFDDILK